jgi:CBS domain-containing protein
MTDMGNHASDDSRRLPDLMPYRRRLAEVMRQPVSSIDADCPLAQAAQAMTAENIGVLLVRRHDQVVGILTERDLTRALAQHGAASAAMRAEAVMTPHIISLPQDTLLFRAIGRMRRFNLRHLPVTDGRGAYIGMVSARALLRQRATEAQSVADAIEAATTAAELNAARASLPALCRTLLEEKLEPVEIAAVISGIYADITARAAALVEQLLEPAPAPWCLLMLGSGGRGESLLVPDQDNAIIHAGSSEDDGWYARAGTQLSDLLNAAGIPYCKGGVMAMNTAWRGAQGQWRARVTEWVRRHSAEALLNVDIFFDLQPIHGERRLGENLRREALAAARASPLFLRLLAEQAAQIHPAIGLFGRLREKEGLIDLKLGGLLPLVSAARCMALKLGLTETSTQARLRAAAARGLIEADDLDGLLQAHDLILRLLLRQQLAALAAGTPPGSRLPLDALPRQDRTRLKAALRHLELLPDMVQNVLTAPATA